MGRYLNFCSSSVQSTFKSYCKIKYLMSILRKCPQLTKTYSHELRKYSHQRLRVTRKLSVQRGHIPHLRKITSAPHIRELQPSVSFYCTSSSRDGFKAEAPVGILEAARYSHLSRLGGRIGQSFNQLSTHINMYFRKKNIVPPAEDDIFKSGQRMTRTQRTAWTVTQGGDSPASKAAIQFHKDDEKSVLQENSGVQLFHSSSLATRFGESYNYVAKHINSIFFRGGAKVEQMVKHSKSEQNCRGKTENHTCEDETFFSNTTRADQQATDAQSFRSWEDGDALFAAHINRYFGARVTDKEKLGENVKSQQSSKPIKPTRPQTFESKDGADGLFHSSHIATHFGESYFQMANHINQYFQSEVVAERNTDEDLTDVEPVFANSGKVKTVSLMDCLLHPSSVSDLINSYLKPPQTAHSMASPRTRWKKKYMNKKQAEEATYNLIATLRQTCAPDVLTSTIEALNEHLIRYPYCRMVLWQEKTAVLLLRKRHTYKNHKGVQNGIREMLALVGYVDAVKGRGIRVLSIDGGGTRGVVPLQVLKVLEAQTGRKIYQLFDYICGVSTGAILAFMLGLARFSLRECEDMYQRFGSEVFRQNPFVGTMKMGWSHSYYNTETWEDILREKLGERLLIKTSRDEISPKVSAVSAVVNWGKSPKAFVFRNYNHTPGSLSRYAGGSGYQMWEAVRASSAAPGYFQEFTLQDDIHQDGGIILNNPCALAVHESRLLWPKQHFQCVLSLGTGRYDSVKRTPATSTSLRAKISNLICSATDTEGVHTLLDDLLAPNVYFRFNPMLSAEVSLDESRPGALDVLRQDTQEYLERNQPKLARLCLVLGAERSAMSKTVDWVSERAWRMKQHWV